ncbi:MAG: hypothetical protein WA183_02330 [Chthoniobacterales bacterium]
MDPTRPFGLGGHAQAALFWIEENRPDLLELLEKERVAADLEDYEEASGMIKSFMFRHGFLRVADDLQID